MVLSIRVDPVSPLFDDSEESSAACRAMAVLVRRIQNTLSFCSCASAKSLRLCLTPWNAMDCNPPGSSVHGILQARILEWVAISFSGDLPNPGIEPGSPALQADSLSEPPGKPRLPAKSRFVS